MAAPRVAARSRATAVGSLDSSGDVEVVEYEFPDATTKRYSIWGGRSCATPTPDDPDAYDAAKNAADAG